MVSLNIILIHAEIVQVDEKAIKHYNPKCRTFEIESKNTHTKHLLRPSDVKPLGDASRHFLENQINNQYRPQGFDYALNHFCPNHGFNPAHHGIYDYADPHYDHDGCH